MKMQEKQEWLDNVNELQLQLAAIVDASSYSSAVKVTAILAVLMALYETSTDRILAARNSITILEQYIGGCEKNLK